MAKQEKRNRQHAADAGVRPITPEYEDDFAPEDKGYGNDWETTSRPSVWDTMWNQEGKEKDSDSEQEKLGQAEKKIVKEEEGEGTQSLFAEDQTEPTAGMEKNLHPEGGEKNEMMIAAEDKEEESALRIRKQELELRDAQEAAACVVSAVFREVISRLLEQGLASVF